jgi:secondary thiamine-phosphate synthase enzyme
VYYLSPLPTSLYYELEPKNYLEMEQKNCTLSFSTGGKKLHNITHEISIWVREQSFETGLLTVFVKHTSASLIIQENADPDVLVDLESFFSRIAPESGNYLHSAEGPDDMPSHIRSALTQTQLSIPLVEGKLALGTWQGIYLFEHRNISFNRKIVLHLIGQ